jgi:hypothetical protein
MTNLTGFKFGPLTVLGHSHTQRKTVFWQVQCECGAITLKRDSNLARAVGCSRVCPITRASYRAKVSTHGMKGHRAYQIWGGMLSRCHKPMSKDWPRCGGRGIAVCDSWRGSFESFWADMGSTYADTLSIDRTNNDGPYEKSNCAWVTVRDNNRNRHNSVVTREQRAIADSHGIAKATLGYRIRIGWPVEKAITVPADKRNRASCL